MLVFNNFGIMTIKVIIELYQQGLKSFVLISSEITDVADIEINRKGY